MYNSLSKHFTQKLPQHTVNSFRRSEIFSGFTFPKNTNISSVKRANGIAGDFAYNVSSESFQI